MALLKSNGFTLALRRCIGIALAAGALLATLAKAPAADVAAAPATQPAMSAAPMWVNHVEPILSKSCFKCHGENKQKGGLDLRSPQSILEGGTDGSVVIAGRPGESPLYQRILPGAKEHMPPEKEQSQLSPEEISFLQEWITTIPLPANHPAITRSGIDFYASAPSLMEVAKQTKWNPPDRMQGSDAIDYAISLHWKDAKVTGNGLCDDATFARRIYLDLAGRIPTKAEADAFVNSNDSQKRAVLADQLLGGEEFPRHMAEILDVVLMDRKGPAAETERRSHGWFDYLTTSIARNRPWNEIVGDLIAARPQSAEQKGAVWFLYERRNNYQQMAEAVAPVAFGVSIGCAQCHNHPLAHEIKQQNYWGLVAAFNRTTNADTNDGPALSESAIGGFVSFTNLKKESQPAILSLLNDRTIEEKRPAEGAKEEDSDANYIVPPEKGAPAPDPSQKRKRRGPPAPRVAAVPKFSRRQAVAEAVLHDNPMLARAFVNRMWGLLLGRGFTNPVDQMDSKHLPSHPELLTWLAGDFEKSGYDIRHLIRTIVLSRTYQLDSHWTGATPPAPELFARGMDKPLSAEVLARSIMVATGHGGDISHESPDGEKLRHALIVAFPTIQEVEYNATLQQAALLTNSPLVDDLLKPADGDLTARLLSISTSDEKVRTAFAEVLGRLPSDDEAARGVEYLNARSDRPEAAVRQLTWALLTSAEFLLNH